MFGSDVAGLVLAAKRSVDNIIVVRLTVQTSLDALVLTVGP